jgi:hypothetical protein
MLLLMIPKNHFGTQLTSPANNPNRVRASIYQVAYEDGSIFSRGILHYRKKLI